jgi:PleD family two-component response regulator
MACNHDIVSHKDLSMAKILLIDDSRLVAHVAKAMLTKRGHEVVLAEDGMAGLEAAKFQGPDLILLDLIMPVMDGYQVCQGLKEGESTQEIPVIMLTSKAEPADKVKGLEMGAVDYVTKPFDEAELVARVSIHLRLKELYETVQEKNRQLQEMANKDGLTGLYNHRFFHEQLSKDFCAPDGIMSSCHAFCWT